MPEIVYINSSNKSSRLALYVFAPPKEAPLRGVVQIIHGMREHMGRYKDFAEFLNSYGFVVVGHDHVGHGLSVSGDEIFGYFGKQDGHLCLLTDCARVTRAFKRMYPKLPFFLLGHSMGSFIGKLHILRHHSGYKGFICMGTAGRIIASPLGLAMAEASAIISPKGRTQFLNDLVTIRNKKKLFISSYPEMAWISRDVQVRRKFTEDKLTNFSFTNAAIRDLITLQMMAASGTWAKKANKNFPILIISGDRDVVGDFGGGPRDSARLLIKYGAEDVTLKLFRGARHEVLNEKNKLDAYYYIILWILRRL